MNKTIKWLDIICRYFICLLMLIYGLVKVFQGQFYTDYYWKDITLGHLSGMELAWSFYSYSPVFETILGLIEVSIGLLVFFKRTTKLGVILFLPVMANLVLINIIFSIGALGSAFPLFVAGIILFLINFRSYKTLISEKQNFVNKKNKLWLNSVSKVIVILMGCGLASLVIYNNKFRMKQDNAIKGAWLVAGNSGIRRIYFEKGNTCVIRDNKDSLYFGNYQTNSNNTISITGSNNVFPGWKEAPYTIHNDTLSVNAHDSQQLLLRIR